MRRRTRLTLAAIAAASLLFPLNAAVASAAPAHGAAGMTRVTAMDLRAAEDNSIQSTPYYTYSILNKTRLSTTYVNTAQLLAQCQSSGGTCTIQQSFSVTRTIQLTAGVTRAWVAGQLQMSSASTVSLSVACTSPVLSYGRVWRAYPLGTRWSYQLRTQQWGTSAGGSDYPIGSATTTGTLYAFNPTGISCR